MGEFRVRNIEWSEGAVLPTEAVVECETVADVADALADTYGWLVADFVIDVATDESDRRR